MQISQRLQITLFISLLALFSGQIHAHHQVIIFGGRLHLTGALVEGDCIPEINGKGIFVDMGQYRSSDFLHIGDLASRTVPLEIRLNGCSGTISKLVKIAFRGATDSHLPGAFETLSADDGEEYTHESGIGLMIFDRENKALYPNAQPIGLHSLTGGEENILFLTARYQKTADVIIPVDLKTTIWFDLIYP